MNTLHALGVLLYAWEALLASAFIPGLAWVAAQGFPKRAGLRHLVWLAALGALLLLPLLAAITPPQIVFEAAPAAAAPQAAAPLDIATAVDPRQARSPVVILAGGLEAIWLVGALVIAAQGALAVLGLRRLRRRSAPFALPELDLPQVRGGFDVRLADAPAGPMTWGFLKPVILLPREAAAWPQQRLRAVLLHELAHVRRRDSLAQTLALFVCALYWPNPVVWLTARRLRREAEIAADDQVLATGVKPSAYAGELLRLATQFRGRQPALHGVAMAGPSALKARIESVLSPTPSRAGASLLDASWIVSLAALAALALALVRPELAQAQVAAAAPLAPAAPPAPPEPPVLQAPPAPVASRALPRVPPAPPRPSSAMPDADLARLGPQIRAQVDRALAQARPEIDRAIAQARIDQKVAEAQARSQTQVDAALARVGPEIEKAIADAHIAERASEAVARAQPQIDAAIARARAAQKAAEAQEKGPEAREKTGDN